MRYLLLSAALTILPTHLFAAAPTPQPESPELMTQAQRESLTVGDLITKSQADLNKIYNAISTGPIPDGESKGYVVFDDSGKNEAEKVLRSVDPDGYLTNFIKSLGTQLWQGKVFFREQNMLMNRVGPLLRFPARVGCGKSLLDSSNESIILDYSTGERLPGYDPTIDWAMTKAGLNIRDEIRMVKPGVYLGRAYAGNGVYVLNFVLSFPGATSDAAAWQDACKRS